MPTSAAESAPESPTPAVPARPTPGRPRRRVRALMATATAVTVLLFAVVGGIGWYFAGVAIEVDRTAEYPLVIMDAGNDTVTLPRTATTERAGTWALVWAGGRALLGPVVGGDERRVVREVAAVVEGTLAKGAPAAIDHWMYDGDPGKALELPFQDVTYPSRIGPMPAWLLPGKTPKSTWVIGVHGRNSDKAETFRVMRTVHEAGLPMMSIAYRNDVGAPSSSDGKNHLGNTEWEDVVSAMGYARAHGATGVILYGWSMGGAMAMTTLRRDPSFVRGVVLDSPVLDWSATLDKQGDARNLPGFITGVAKRVLEWRIGIDLTDFDHRRYAPQLRTPVLLFTAADDATVANGPAHTFAAAAPPGMVTHITTPGDHTESWNVNPVVYERALGAFLEKVR
ncbi:alpha/beta fold hydrolase [Actinomadura sp. 7K534]|uniref:alpha/beta hydrolase family protein n=1 Tax=Actinomadura sp. 7K534 TaxID=2530366 RepID=UPI001043F499|nr:alpha/beta fold hydrolase [Actinomadura sp. 7K534]TDB97199.1 alpha/beta fold hydrolase [Actinomadura sp. 7K534]